MFTSDFIKNILLGAVLGGVLLMAVFNVPKAFKALTAKPAPAYLYLVVKDCPGGFEAVFHKGEVRPDGWWYLQVGTESLRVKPAETCSQAIQSLPASYSHGDKFRWLAVEPATASAKKK